METWKYDHFTLLCQEHEVNYIPASRQKMKALQIKIESARAIPGSAKVLNLSSACGSVIKYESATVVR